MNTEDLTTGRWHLMNVMDIPWEQSVTDSLLELINEKLGFAPPGVGEHPIAPLPDFGVQQKVALCLGHGRSGDEGNVGAGGVSEEDFNLPLIQIVANLLRAQGVDVVIISYYQGNGYTAAMVWLAQELERLGVTLALEFHFNAYDKTVSGHEVCHWKGSKRGIVAAKFVNDSYTEHFPSLPNRGLKPKSPQDRGALFLSLTHCPAVILEPFFGDNPKEWGKMSRADSVIHLADANAQGILNYLAWERGQSVV